MADSYAERSRICEGLQRAGFPFGLAKLASEDDWQVGLRIFLLDNSGSTNSPDGKKLKGETSMKMEACTRWEEIKEFALAQARLHRFVGNACEFMLLNPPQPRDFMKFREGVDYCTINGTTENADVQLARFERMMGDARPQGTTPLADRFREIGARLAQHKPKGPGQRVVVVVVTDGEPTNAGMAQPTPASRNEMLEELRKLGNSHALSLVVRLATNEDHVVRWYNQIDKEVEFSYDVIDDIEAEAQEALQCGNGFVTYSQLIHSLRSCGTEVKLLDKIDEKKLAPLEVMNLVEGMLRQSEGDPQLPRDVVDFMKASQSKIKKMKKVYNPLTKKMSEPINLSQLKKALGVKSGPCICQ